MVPSIIHVWGYYDREFVHLLLLLLLLLQIQYP